MRVIEPNRFPTKAKKKRTGRRFLNSKKLVAILASLLIILGIFFYTNNKAEAPTPSLVQADVSEVLTQNESAGTEETGLRQFSGNEFRLLFDNMILPNTLRVELPPSISGNEVADARIRQLAETRGYKLRRSPQTSLTNVDGYPLQDSVQQPWLDLKAEAASDQIIMTIVSAYRSVDDQRALFLSRLNEAGVTISAVEAGTADVEVDKLLTTTSIPGYSKHHTGYVFDLLCNGWVFEKFIDSSCHDWLSKNNYEMAKKHGFIPSYPADADLQGPNPEAWEYVYVGSEILNN